MNSGVEIVFRFGRNKNFKYKDISFMGQYLFQWKISVFGNCLYLSECTMTF